MSAAVALPLALQAGGQLLASEGAAGASEFNADVARAQRRLALQRGKFAEARSREQARRFRGEQRAAVGASGTTFTGSPLLVIAEAAEDAELDALAIRFGTKTEMNAAQARRDAAQFRRNVDRATGFLRAAGTGARLLGNFGGATGSGAGIRTDAAGRILGPV